MKEVEKMIKLKRVYSAREKGDGFRILVDRIWPRGISAELCQNYPIVTLVYGAKNEQQNQAVVLKALMERKLNR